MKHSNRFVVVTRPDRESKAFIQQLEKIGVSVFSYPTIAITKNLSSKTIAPLIKDLSSYDWILFTSKNGVRYFMDAFSELGIKPKSLQRKQIGAVGPKTAEEIKKYELQVHFIPSRYTTDDLARELQNITGKKILLPRTDIATPTLTKQLEAKGAIVVNIPIYKTEYVIEHNKKFDNLLDNNQILCITFTSPSTVEGFVQNLKRTHDKERVFSIPVLSIGSVTTKAVKKHGFRSIYTADIHTTDGMLTKLKESIL